MNKIDKMENLWRPFTPNKEFNKNPRLFVSSDKMHYVDSNNNKILDAVSGLWCCNLGHNHKKIVEAVTKQAQTMYYATPFNAGHYGEYELASLLTDITPKHLNHVFLTNSGSESVDSALKMALAYQKSIGEGSRSIILGRLGSYHGVNFGGTSVGGLLGVKRDYVNLINTFHLPSILDIKNNAFSKGVPSYGDFKADSLQDYINTYGAENIAALILEPVAGSVGVHVPPAGYLKKIEKICKDNGILLIFDEVITGFGRLGTPFAADRFDISPDIMTLAKGLSNGAAPIGAVVASDKVYDSIIGSKKGVEFAQGYTYSGHPLSCAVAIATLKAYAEDKLFEKVAQMESFFEDEIHKLKDSPNVIDIRNIGLMGGIELSPSDHGVGKRAMDIYLECYKNGVLVRPNADVIAISPPYIINKEEIKHIIATIGDAINTVDSK